MTAFLAAAAGVPRLPASFSVPVTAAFAGQAGDEAQRKLDDRAFFVRKLGRGWEPLVADCAAVLEDLPEAERGAPRAVRDAVYEEYAALRLGAGDEAGTKRAFQLFDVLSRDHADPARRTGFARTCSEIDVRWAERALAAKNEQDARSYAEDALRRTPGFGPAEEILAKLVLLEVDRAEAKDDFFTALDVLGKSAEALPAGGSARKLLEERRTAILGSTGEVSIEWLGEWARLAAVQGPRTDYRAADLTFRPVADGKAPPVQKAGKPIRIRTGRYQVTARGEGTVEHRVAQPVEVTPAGGSFVLLTALPEGMVVVPATGAQDAFLIDRTEVSNAVYQQYGGKVRVGGTTVAASGVDFPDAQAFVRRIGKDLPTLDQWTTAAFGSPRAPSPRYPWGDQAGSTGTQWIGDTEAPAAVDSCPAGAARGSGCLNMAGNVWEWLADGWFIGASYAQANLEREFDETDNGYRLWKADFLRDPAPSLAVHGTLSQELQYKHATYRVKDQKQVDQIGLRCVVPLGKPRRNP